MTPLRVTTAYSGSFESSQVAIHESKKMRLEWQLVTVTLSPCPEGVTVTDHICICTYRTSESLRLNVILAAVTESGLLQIHARGSPRLPHFGLHLSKFLKAKEIVGDYTLFTLWGCVIPPEGMSSRNLEIYFLPNDPSPLPFPSSPSASHQTSSALPSVSSPAAPTQVANEMVMSKF